MTTIDNETPISPRRPSKKRIAQTIAATAALATAFAVVSPVIGDTAAADAASTYKVGKAIVSDSMSRTQSSGWGKYSSSVSYSSTGTEFSVNGSRALIALPASGKTKAVNTNYKLQDVVSTYKVSTNKLATSGAGIYSSLLARKSAAGDYRATLRVSPQGVSYLELSRWTPGGMKQLKTPVKLGFKVAANKQVNVKLEVTGKPSVSVRAKAWPVGSTEPTSWTTAATDSSSEALTSAGTVEVSAYRGSNSPVATLSYDDLVISPMTATTTSAPTTVAPTVPTTPPASSSTGYVAGWGNPVWQDEFNGSLSKWTVRDDATHGVLSYDRAIIKKENATTKDGVLTIRGKRMDKPVVKSGTRAFSTGYIDSIGKFSQKYGRWEMRAKLPLTKGNSKGIWPAFWLRPDGAKTGGEIDIMEAYGTPISANTSFDPFNRSEGTLHYDQTGKNKTNSWIPVTDLSGGYHTWTFEWTPEGMTWLFDGKPFKTVKRAGNAAYEKAFETAAKFHIRLNTQYGSPYWGMPDSTTKDTADFKVDYVRAWAYKG
ncbi:glycoside hydrolase family 16 protein [Glutamicibacter soli]